MIRKKRKKWEIQYINRIVQDKNLTVLEMAIVRDTAITTQAGVDIVQRRTKNHSKNPINKIVRIVTEVEYLLLLMLLVDLMNQIAIIRENINLHY